MNAIRFAAVVTILFASLIAAAQAMPAAAHYYFYNKGWEFRGSNGYYIDPDVNWNIRSIACYPDSTASPQGNCTQVYYYSATAGKWMLWDFYKPDTKNDFTEINAYGYWFNVSVAGHTKDIDDPGIFETDPIKSGIWGTLTNGWNIGSWRSGSEAAGKA